jgi:uncharacterized protein DUF6455
MPAPVTRERQSIYMCEMMERLGIEPGGGVAPYWGLSYATDFRRCEACPSKQACRVWIDSKPAFVAFAPRFCANTDIFHLGHVIRNRSPPWLNRATKVERFEPSATFGVAAPSGHIRLRFWSGGT